MNVIERKMEADEDLENGPMLLAKKIIAVVLLAAITLTFSGCFLIRAILQRGGDSSEQEVVSSPLGLTPVTVDIKGTQAVYFLELLNLFDELPDYDEATVRAVVDGDTISLRREGSLLTAETVRMIGLDTPETVHPDKDIEYYGVEASGFAKALLDGEEVFLSYDWNSIDKYGRTLAYVWLPISYEGQSFNALFNLLAISSGYGHAYTSYVFNDRYMEFFVEAERLARLSSRGLWSGDDFANDNVVLEYDPIVYITSTGSKYHLESCHYLANSKIRILLSEAKRRDYTPCGACKPPR